MKKVKVTDKLLKEIKSAALKHYTDYNLTLRNSDTYLAKCYLHAVLQCLPIEDITLEDYT